MTNIALENANLYDNIANAIEEVRKRYCAYGADEDCTCDCKYAGWYNEMSGQYNLFNLSREQTGCGELRKTVRSFRLIAEAFREAA